MSLETEMLLEQNQREMESVRAMVYEEQRSAEEERSRLSLQHHREMQVYREEMATQLERAHKLEQELSGLHALHQQEISSFTQEAQDARNRANQLQEQLAILEEKWSACEEQSRGHADEIAMMELKHQEMLETCLQEQKERLQEEKEMQERLAEQWEQERECLQKRHEEVFRAHLEETQQRKEQECVELERRLKEDWERERLELEKSSKETLEAVLEERRERERRFREKWDEEHALLEKEHYEVLLQRLEEERECLHAQQEETERMMMEHWERKRAQLEKQHEELLQACLEQEREKVQAEREEQERMWQNLLKEEQSRMEEAHREAALELSAKHCEEKERLSCILENLRTDIAQERSEVCRLAKENLILRHRISTVREEDLRENQENFRLQHMKQGKRAAQALRRQLSEPRRLGHHLDEENVLLQLNPDHVLRHTSQEVMLPHDHSPANEKNGLFQLFDREDFVFRKEKDLLRAELNRLIEKGMSLESSLQTLTQQNAHLKSDLRITQQERDALKQEVISLHKQMQSANEKLLEVSVVSVGQQQGRRLWAELSGLMEAEHASLMDENQRLKRQMSEMNSELLRAREQICQLEALSLKQRALVKGADQEKSALKRELDALHSQLISSRNKTQRAALLPSSSLQLPGEQRGQHHSDGPDFSMQDEREVALLHMEDRMREVEVTLRNLKLLLQEKVSQLKEQLTRNSEAEVLIKDLYVENAQLLKALEKTEQRQKVAEKKNFLLEEKISSLNKIVRDLGPSPLTPSPYHFTRS